MILDEKREPSITAQEIIDVQEMVDAASLSAKEKRPVDLKWFISSLFLDTRPWMCQPPSTSLLPYYFIHLLFVVYYSIPHLSILSDPNSSFPYTSFSFLSVYTFLSLSKAIPSAEC